MKKLYLEWDDSSSLGGRGVWRRQDEKPVSLMCKTAGFVISEDAKSITIAGHITPEGDMAGEITIPKCAITKRRILSHKK